MLKSPGKGTVHVSDFCIYPISNLHASDTACSTIAAQTQSKIDGQSLKSPSLLTWTVFLNTSRIHYNTGNRSSNTSKEGRQHAINYP